MVGETNMDRSTYKFVVLLFGALGLCGCVHYSHTLSEEVHDDELTMDDYDGTTSYEAPDGETEAEPPVPVHEFDADAAEAGGASQVIDGQQWLDADDFERNALLNKAESDAPEGTVFVIVVATGAVWKIPPSADDLIADGKIKEWSDRDYDNLDEYVGEAYQPEDRVTVRDFRLLAEVANQQRLPMIYYIHDLGPIGVKEIESAHGFEVIPHHQWIAATPQRRYLELESIDKFVMHLPRFQGAENRPVFGTAIPWGTVYVAPQRNYLNLLEGGAIKYWTAEELSKLQYTVPGTDRWSRDVKPLAAIDFKF
jgi:hypothetical protein